MTGGVFALFLLLFPLFVESANSPLDGQVTAFNHCIHWNHFNHCNHSNQCYHCNQCNPFQALQALQPMQLMQLMQQMQPMHCYQTTGGSAFKLQPFPSTRAERQNHGGSTLINISSHISSSDSIAVSVFVDFLSLTNTIRTNPKTKWWWGALACLS